jgi:hypothetical protein
MEARFSSDHRRALRHGARARLTPNPQAPLREQVHEVMRFFH